MGNSSSITRPQELLEFRKLNTSIENVEIPASAESRTVTDKKGFLIFGIGIVVLLPFLIYTLVKSDLRHLITGTDDCANFCGYDNLAIEGASCSGRDFTSLPYLKELQCVDHCPSNWAASIQGICEPVEIDRYGTFRHRQRNLLRYNSFESENKNIDYKAGLEACRAEGWKFLIAILVTIALSLLVLVMLRFMPAPVVWFIIVLTIVVLITVSGFLWFGYFTIRTDREPVTPLLILAIVWTVIALIIIIVLICLFKRIRLMIQLYKEATKVLAAMPMLVLIPILTAIIQVIIFGAFIASTIWMVSARELYNYGDEKYIYESNGAMVFAIIFNFIITAWSMRFINGIQYMWISGSVARWYFAKNKQYLDSPISSSFAITMKFHVGTIALGSFVLTLFEVVKAILRACCRNACCRCLVVMCCKNVEVILKFLSENSYIETAIHGQSYFRSAKRATKLLLKNASSVIAINCVGDFVLGIIVLITIILSTAISYALFMNIGLPAMIPTAICFILNTIIVCIMFATFQTIIDSLFICFCEDSVLNDGMARPYYMSRGLMEFVENSKKAYEIQNGR